MEITFLGGASEVGASSILVNINGKNILMDCGIRQGNSGDILPDFRTIQEKGGLDGIIISHAHMDHIGSLPIIAKEYPLAKIYCNNMTKDLMRVLLYDSIKIMNGREVEIPLYNEQHVEEVLKRTYTYNFETPFLIFEDIKVTFYMAGHIAGAACIYITSRKGSIFYSGDFSIFPQIAIEGAKIPKLRPDVAILEGTYGNKLHSARKLEEEKLVEIVKDIIQNGGKALIPAFALGRAQEVILILKRAINNKNLPKTKIYVDGMVRDINIAFKRNPIYLKRSLCKKILKGTEPFYDDNIIAISNKSERDEILQEKEPVVIISSSGMLTGGPSQYYAEKLLMDENSAIIISGYQDEESPGRKILNLFEIDKNLRTLEINNKTIPVKCDIRKVALSAHGDKSEIKALHERLTPKNLFLVHGDKEVISTLGKEIASDSIGRVYVPKVGDCYSINIKNPRKQLIKKFEHRMERQEIITEDCLKDLREFIIRNYGIKLFTAEELLIIWGKENKLEKETIENLQKLLMESIYFENDPKRLFMFSPATEDELSEKISSKELNQNQVYEIIKDSLDNYELKKIGLKPEEKIATLYFDFPNVLSKEAKDIIDELKEEIGWNIEINPQINLNAINTIVKIMLGDKVEKISHYLVDKKIIIKVNSNVDMDKIKKEFHKTTGLNIYLKEELKEETPMPIGKNIIEQNALIAMIDNRFKNEKFKPYKKSIIKPGYMKLSFISPKAGNIYEEKIKILSKESRWNLQISDSYNQNEIINIAEALCIEYGIALKKRPSFDMQKGAIKIQYKGDVTHQVFENFIKSFYDKTLIDVAQN